MDISFGDQKVKINIFNASKWTHEEENCSVVELVDEIVESDFSSKLVEELTQSPQETQEVNALLDSSHQV